MNEKSKFVRMLLGRFRLLLETVPSACVCACLSSALYCLLWLGVIVEGRAGCACLGNDSSPDAFDVVVE